MTTAAAWGVALGALLGSGLWLVLVRLPAMRKVHFSDRIAAQLRSGRTASRLLHGQASMESPFGPLAKIMWPVFKDLIHALNRFNPASESLTHRLTRAGLHLSITDFRVSQLLWSLGGLLLGGVLVAASAAGGTFNGMLAVLVLATSAVAGFLLREWYLTEQGLRRGRRILRQFPGVAELMALAVGAGDSTIGAIERVAASSRGDLAQELEATLMDIRAGSTLTQALHGLSSRVELNAMTRFVDAITVAAERGTPLSEVMRAQAQDVRDSAKRELMEMAGRKEIAMMVPVVFGILPLTIVFAVYPGLSLIDLNL